MKRSSVFYLILLTIAVSIAGITLPVYAQTAGPTNPRDNVTAYDLLQQQANQTGVSKHGTIAPLSINTDLPTYNQGDT